MEVRRVEAGEGARLRELRLRALRESPGAFRSRPEYEEPFPAEEWERRAGGVLEKLGMRREAHLLENEWVKGEWPERAGLRAARGRVAG